MAECIIARGGGKSSEETTIPIIPTAHSILTTVTDSSGIPIADLSVHCKDGNTWYNYHTNEKGQVLFVTNSGAANITAYNCSINGNYKYIDQESVMRNLDAPIGSTTKLNLSLSFVTGERSYSSMSGDILNSTGSVLYTGNYKVRVANYANVFLGGAGGGGGATNPYQYCISGGGGGGGITLRNNVVLDKNTNYQFWVGAGGSGGSHYSSHPNGTAGSSTSGFGLVANGGGFGGLGGGNGQVRIVGAAGTGDYSGGAGQSEASQWANWGGGGAICQSGRNVPGGSPYGGWSNNYRSGGSGSNGGGGGSGGWTYGSAWNQPGGRGGPGKISLEFRSS